MDIAARPGQVPPLIVAGVRRESVIASGAACYRLHYLRIGRQRSMTMDRQPSLVIVCVGRPPAQRLPTASRH